MGQPCRHPWPSAVPTSAGREAKLGKEPQRGFGGLVPWLAEQEGCQALPQLGLQLCFLGLPGKCLVCHRDGDSPEPPGSLPGGGLPREKHALLEQQTATPGTQLSCISAFI